MRAKRGALAQKRHYPDMCREWALNANRARWGQPMKELPKTDSPRAAVWCEKRRVEHAQLLYEQRRRRADEQEARRLAALPVQVRAREEQARITPPGAKSFLDL